MVSVRRQHHEGKAEECMLARKTRGDGGPPPNPKTATQSDVRQFPAAAMPIGEDHRFAEASRVLRELNAEIDTLRKRTVQKLQGATWLHCTRKPRKASPVHKRSKQAQRLLAGEAVDDFSDAPSKIRKAQHKLAILEPAAREQAQRLEVIRGEASAAAGERVKVRHRKALLDILRAARLLAMASNAELMIRGELLQNGYQILDAYTPPPRFGVPLLLGAETIRDGAMAFQATARRAGCPLQ
jgi:hypothetical protein